MRQAPTNSPAEPNSAVYLTAGTLNKLLKPIGLFIGTYGLAVFLVIYYAIWLYPETQRERGEWIHEITLLRQLIDPGTRSLTRDQTRIMLELVSDAFVDRLYFSTEDRDRENVSQSSTYRYSSEDSDTIVLQFFGETIQYKRSNTNKMELERFYDTVLRLINDRKKAAAANADAWFEYIADYSKRDSYRLAQLKFGSVNLEQIWRASYEPAVKEWKSRKQDWIRTRDRYQIERAERFLLGHPAAESKEDEFRKYFSGIEYRGVSDHLRGFQEIISSKIEQQVTFYDRHQD